MTIKVIEKRIGFQRGLSIKGSLKIGGLDYFSLSIGALIRTKRSMALTGSSGKVTSFHSGYKIMENDLLMIVKITEDYGDNLKTSHTRKFEFIRFHRRSRTEKMNLDKAQESKEIFKEYGSTGGYRSVYQQVKKLNMANKQFSNRFEIIERGF